MLLRCMVMVGLAVSALALAACAEVGEALATEAAARAANIAATQAEILTTQYVTDIEQAATQMAEDAATSQPILPPMPNVGNATYVIFTPTLEIVQYKGHRYIFQRKPLDDDDSQ